MTYPPPPEQPEFGQPGQAAQPPDQTGQPPHQTGQPPHQAGQPYQAGQPPYQYAPPPPAGYPGYPGAQPTRLRGRMPLRLALIFGVIGLAMVIVGGVVIAKKSFSKVDNFDRVDVGATGSVTFDKTGNYLAYYEGHEVDDNIKRVPLSAVTLTSPSGRSIRLDTLYGGKSLQDGTIDTKLTYDYHGHKGVAIYQYKIKEKGTYQVSIQPTGGESTGSDYAFGKSIGGALALGVGLIIPGVLFIVTAIILLIVGLVKRSRHKKQLQTYGNPPPGYPQQGYPQQGWSAPHTG